ncbi:MAG TPA: YlxR family protein [Firmicutes bacterium]|nr:YlxR family protein [Bacillota bacterium]
MGAKKRVPQRTCIGCKTVKDKRELVRIVRTPEGEVLMDLTGKRSGRGAYICPSEECLELVISKKGIERALGRQPDPEELAALRKTILRADIIGLGKRES